MFDLFGPVPHDPGGRSKPRWPKDSVIDANFSDCGQYRYSLSEIWDNSLPTVMFILMNPSVAGIEHSDPTLRRTGSFARSWKYGGQYIGNIFAYRATDNKRLLEIDDPIGHYNDVVLLDMAKKCNKVVLGYGLPPKHLRERGKNVVKMLQDANIKLTYLRLSKDGTPQHPLYLPGDLVPIDYN